MNEGETHSVLFLVLVLLDESCVKGNMGWSVFDFAYILKKYDCAFSGQAEEGSDEVYCQVLLVPESEVRFLYDVDFT